MVANLSWPQCCLVTSCSIWSWQGSFCECTQPIGDNVTLYLSLWLAGCIRKKIILILVNIFLINGLLPDNTNPLLEAMLTNCHWTIRETHFIEIKLNYKFFFSSRCIWKHCVWNGGLFLHNNQLLTHWGRVTHICVSKLTIIGSDNGLPPDRRQAIIWTNAGILLIRALGTNFSEILGKIHSFSLKKCIWKCHLRKGVYLVSASMS